MSNRYQHAGISCLRPEVDKERLKRWIQASHCVGNIEPFIIVFIQDLGRLDSRLILGDERLCRSLIEGHTSIDEGLETTDHIMLSRLWVLGAYEVVRCLENKCRNNAELVGAELNCKLKELKHTYTRLRIPLAKLEPAESYKDIDSPIAYPAIHKNLGVSWQVAKDVYITRRELSDRLLCLLEDILKNL